MLHKPFQAMKQTSNSNTHPSNFMHSFSVTLVFLLQLSILSHLAPFHLRVRGLCSTCFRLLSRPSFLICSGSSASKRHRAKPQHLLHHTACCLHVVSFGCLFIMLLLLPHLTQRCSFAAAHHSVRCFFAQTLHFLFSLGASAAYTSSLFCWTVLALICATTPSFNIASVCTFRRATFAVFPFRSDAL